MQACLVGHLAVVPQPADGVQFGGAGGGQDTAFGAGQNLGRVERERSVGAEGAGRGPVETGAEGVRRVLDQRDPPGPAGFGDLVDRGGDHAADVDHGDGRHIGVPLQGLFQRCGVQPQAVELHVDEVHDGPGADGGRGGGEEGVDRDQHGAAGHPDGTESDLQRGRAGADRDRLPTHPGFGPGLELGDLRAEGECPGGQRLVDPVRHLPAGRDVEPEP